jgi:hypothetical protein
LGSPTWDNNYGVVALAGGGLTAATPVLLRGVNVVTTVASGSDSVVLRKAIAGAVVLVRNATANAMQVFGNGSDTINGTAGATGISVAGNKSVLFFAGKDGVWFSLLTA